MDNGRGRVAQERTWKCTIRDGKHVEACTALSESSEFGHPRGKAKGIFSWQYTDMNTSQRTRTFYGAKSGARVRGGIVFNYCPFCGEKIDGPVNELTPQGPP